MPRGVVTANKSKDKSEKTAMVGDIQKNYSSVTGSEQSPFDLDLTAKKIHKNSINFITCLCSLLHWTVMRR